MVQTDQGLTVPYPKPLGPWCFRLQILKNIILVIIQYLNSLFYDTPRADRNAPQSSPPTTLQRGTPVFTLMHIWGHEEPHINQGNWPQTEGKASDFPSL